MASGPPIYRPGGPAQLTPVQAPDQAAYGGDIAHAVGEVGQAVDQYQDVEHELAREQQSFAFQKASTDAAVANTAYADDLKSKLPPGAPGYAEQVASHFDEVMRPTLDAIADRRLRMRAGAQLQEQRADVVLRAAAWEKAQGAIKVGDDAEAAAGTRAQGLYLDPSWASLKLARKQNAEMWQEAASVDGNQRAHGTLAANGQAFVQGFSGLLAQGRTKEAAEWLQSPEAAELGKDVVPQLGEHLRVTQARLDSQAKASANVDYETKDGALGLQAQQYQLGRPTFNEAKTLGNNFSALAAIAPTPEKRTAALKNAATWQAQATDIGASEAYRAATDEQRNLRIQELRAKPTLTAEEGSELRGLKGQADYVSKQTAVGHLAYATGRPVDPVDFADPASVARRAATFQAALAAGYGTSGSAVLEPDEVQKAHEIATGGQLGDKVGLLMAMEQFGRLIDPVREQIGGDADFHAAVALTRRPTSRAIIAMTLEGAKAHDKAVMTVAKDEAGQPLTRSPDEIRNIYFGGSAALLPPDYVSDQNRNIENLYYYKAKATGTKAFDPDLWAQAAKEAMGAGSATWAGDRVLLPEGMSRDSFYRRMATATPQDWRQASRGGELPMTSGGEMTPAELRNYVPTKVADGVYQLRLGQGTGASYARNKDGSFFTFDPAKLYDGPRLSAPHPKDVDAEIERGLRNRTIR